MSEEEIIAVIKEGLRAVAFASLSNGNFCHLTMKDGLLVEHVSGVERIVSSSSRDPPSAVYVTGENQTLIMYADGAGALRAAKFNQHNRGWSQVQAPLCQHPARHNQSRIGAASVLDGAIVFFQRNDGTLHSICFDRASQWYDGFDAPEKGKAGTPIAVFVMPEALAVAFFNVDDELKCHRRNFSSGVWSGNLIAKDLKDAENMGIVYDGESFEAFILLRSGGLEIVSDRASESSSVSMAESEDRRSVWDAISTAVNHLTHMPNTVSLKAPVILSKVAKARIITSGKQICGTIAGGVVGSMIGIKVGGERESRETVRATTNNYSLISLTIGQRTGCGDHRYMESVSPHATNWRDIWQSRWR